VYLVSYGPAELAILRYGDFDLWQSAAQSHITFSKGAPEDVTVNEFVLDGRPAYWIEGGEHVLIVFDEAGERIADSERTVARNTLIFATDRAFYRVETDLSRDEAVAIAETLP
jgi:hypothetical protein